MDDEQKRSYFGSRTIKPDFSAEARRTQTDGSSALALDSDEPYSQPHASQPHARGGDDRQGDIVSPEEFQTARQLRQAELDSAGESSRIGSDSVALSRVRNAEENPGEIPKVNVTGQVREGRTKGKGSAKAQKSTLRKAAPIGGVIAGLVLLVFGGVFLFGPTTLVGNILQLVKDTDPSGFTSDRRKNLINNKKLTGEATTKFTNRYRNMKQSTANRYVNNDIELFVSRNGFDDPVRVQYETDDGGNRRFFVDEPDGSGRTYIEGRFEGKNRLTGIADGVNVIDGVVDSDNIIRAGDFNSSLLTNPKIRRGINRVYHPLVANMADGVSRFFKGLFDWDVFNHGTRGLVDIDNMDEAIDRTRVDANGDPIGNGDGGRLANVEEGRIDVDPETGNVSSSVSQGAGGRVGDVMDGVARGAVDGTASIKSAARAFGVFDTFDDAADWTCMAYSSAVGFVNNKKVRIIGQLAAFAMLTLSVMDSVKGGEADARDVSELMNSVTASSSHDQIDINGNPVSSGEVDENGNVIPNQIVATGTESQAFRWLQFDDPVEYHDGSARNYIPGGGIIQTIQSFGLGGLLLAAAATTLGALSNLCRVTNSWGYILASLALTAVLLVLSGGTSAAVLGANVLRNIGIRVAIGALLGGLFGAAAAAVWGDIIGTDIQGQDFTNAMIIGAGAGMGLACRGGGCVALGKQEATAQYLERQQYLALKAEEDRLGRPWYDVSSKNTFLGSIVSNIAPQLASIRLGSLGSVFTSLGTIGRRSFAAVSPSASAYDFTKFQYNLNACKDDAYEYAGVATDPFCNPIYGNMSNLDNEYVIEDLYKEFEAFTDQDGYIKAGSDGGPAIETLKCYDKDGQQTWCVDEQVGDHNQKIYCWSNNPRMSGWTRCKKSEDYEKDADGNLVLDSQGMMNPWVSTQWTDEWATEEDRAYIDKSKGMVNIGAVIGMAGYDDIKTPGIDSLLNPRDPEKDGGETRISVFRRMCPYLDTKDAIALLNEDGGFEVKYACVYNPAHTSKEKDDFERSTGITDAVKYLYSTFLIDNRVQDNMDVNNLIGNG